MYSKNHVRYEHQALRAFAQTLFNSIGMEESKSPIIADVLVEADLLGHDTHGLNLLAPYLTDIDAGVMAVEGEPTVISDLPAAIAWDGKRLSGVWLTATALDLAINRAKTFGTCAVTIARGHHIACLAAYLLKATEQGMLAIITSSAPEISSVAPHGGKCGVLTPNPIAAGWPTRGLPVLLDVSTSITTNGMVTRKTNESERLPGCWLIDKSGKPTDDPRVVTTNLSDSRGALLPIGGLEYGHKGFSLGLMVEALTQGLSGHGRADSVQDWTGEVFLQVLNPKLFGGQDRFLRQTTWLSEACQKSEPLDPQRPVRMPGERGLEKRTKQLRDGIELHPSIIPSVTSWAQKLKVKLPQPLT